MLFYGLKDLLKPICALGPGLKNLNLREELSEYEMKCKDSSGFILSLLIITGTFLFYIGC